MKILVIGSGGREHALAWKISQSKRVEKIFCAPANAGISEIAESVPIKAVDINKLLEFAKKEAVDLTVVGPEAPLALGIVDEFQKNGLKIFGPQRFAAKLEASKVFSKQVMAKYGVPTAEFKVFSDADQAKEYVAKKGAPCVVKADGLAQGKGVVVAKTIKEAQDAITLIMQEGVFGEAGNHVVIEECLIGQEASILILTDGEAAIPLASSQDHKRVFDNDEGLNTGGMGAYSPAPAVTPEIFKYIEQKIIQPMIKGLAKEGIVYRGVLYAGIMLTAEGPKVLEFNVRFGDPETQAILPRLKSDIVEVMLAVAEGKLSSIKKLDWDDRACVCVTLAAGGYPGPYEKAKVITGLEEVKKMTDVIAFHSGTRKFGDKIVTDGGRVLGVTALGANIKEAITRCYQGVDKIKFEGMHFRRDIGVRAV